MRARVVVLVILGFVSSGLVVAPPSAAGAVRLADPEGHVSWSGGFEDVAGASTPEAYLLPGACDVLACEELLLEIDLPGDVWTEPGGVQIAIDWFPHEHNDLDLYVYGPDGDLAARSDGFFASTGEAVRIASAPNGTYRIVVVPRLVDGAMAYQGFAEVERDPAVEPVRELRPNLVALAPRNPHLRTGAYLFDHGQDVPTSCYPEETIEQGAHRCLRFDQIIANLGDGPLELRYRMEGAATEQELFQRVYRSDGSSYDRLADTYTFHATHAHFHYNSFGQSFLYEANEDGTKGALVREGRKVGFCLIDVENTRFGLGPDGEPLKGEAPRTYYFPRCNSPTERDETGTYMVNGISVGWADVYNWFLADQYIEITGVEPGLYILETVADPNETVLETVRDDNASSVVIRLDVDSAEIVQPGP